MWARLFRAGATELFAALENVSEPPCRLWTQDLYGARTRFVGAVHGFAGNVVPVLRGRQLLSAEEQSQWSRCVRETIARDGAAWERLGELAVECRTPEPDRPVPLVQHCHGAPGIVNCLAAAPDPALDELLIAAGELTWAAGPLAKGANLCHGTAGNGYAFLKLFGRTQDVLWLERARAFACTRSRRANEICWNSAVVATRFGLEIWVWRSFCGPASRPTTRFRRRTFSEAN